MRAAADTLPSRLTDREFWNMIEKFSEPNDLIYDPFLGGGTTAYCALKKSRRFMGSDIDLTAWRNINE